METRVEKRLKQLLLETTLDVINYQNTYDKMKSVEDIKVEVIKLRKLLSEEYIPTEDKYTYIASLKTLDKSAPENPGVLSATSLKLMSSPNGFPFE